jgi:hypothetical protein
MLDGYIKPMINSAITNTRNTITNAKDILEEIMCWNLKANMVRTAKSIMLRMAADITAFEPKNMNMNDNRKLADAM